MYMLVNMWATCESKWEKGFYSITHIPKGLCKHVQNVFITCKNSNLGDFFI